MRASARWPISSSEPVIAGRPRARSAFVTTKAKKRPAGRASEEQECAEALAPAIAQADSPGYS